jgi:hypothetical protein
LEAIYSFYLLNAQCDDYIAQKNYFTMLHGSNSVILRLVLCKDCIPLQEKND